MTFKDHHPEMQHLVRELALVRSHNLGFKEGSPDPSAETRSLSSRPRGPPRAARLVTFRPSG